MSTLSDFQASAGFHDAAAAARAAEAPRPFWQAALVVALRSAWFAAMAVFVWRGASLGNWLSAALAAGFAVDQALQLARALGGRRDTLAAGRREPGG